MNRLLIGLILSCLIASSLAVGANPIRDLIAQKARLAKTSLTQEPVLRAHGTGLTDGQEQLIVNLIDQAMRYYTYDIYENALYIQQKVEDSFSGRWAVEIFKDASDWGRVTHIKNDQWVLLFGYGSYEWDYIIWAPEC